MATENVGGIQYTVDADTAAMIKAEAVVNKSIAKQVAQFEKADQAVRDYITTQKEMGRTINQMGQVMDKNGNVVVASTMQYRKLAEQAGKSFNAVNKDVTKSAGAVNRALTSNLGQAGIQVQQFVGQLQGGQSAMVALAQQSADLGIVLGAPLIGVVVSLAAVLAGTLAPAVFGSVSNIEKLEKAIENTKAIMTLGKNGIIEYTDEMKRLETASENLAKIKVALAITENTKALKESRKEFMAIRADIFEFQESASEAAKRLTGMTDKTGDVLDLASSLQALSNAVTDEQKLKILERTEKTLLSMRNPSGEFPTKDLAELAQQFFTLSDVTRQAIANNKALTSANENLDTSASATGESYDKLRISMKEQLIALKDGERAAFKYSLVMSKEYTPAQIMAALKTYDTIEALKEQKRATEEAEKANRQYEDSVRKKTESDLAWFEQQVSRMEVEDQQATTRLTTQVQSIGLTPEEEIQARYDRELELLQQAEEKKIEIEGTYAQRRAQLESERIAAMQELHAKNNEFLQNAFGNLDTQIAGTFAQVAMGAKDGEDALRDLANTMINQVVGAAVQYGIEMVKNKILGKSLAASEQANILATTSTGIASQQAATASTVAAAGATAVAAAPAAALTSTFSFGSAAVIGGAALLGTLAIAKMMSGGAREFGGPVTAGKSYLVGERGPEIFTPNSPGGITSNKDLMSGNNSQGETFNINFNMTDTSDSTFQEQVYRNADLFVGIIRSYKNNQGESF